MADPIDFLTGRPMRWGYDTNTAPEGMRDVYRALAPKPGTFYGDVLPIAVDPDHSWRLAMPNFVRDGLLGVADLLSGTETGEVTGRGALSLGLSSLGAGATTAPRGALAAGGAISHLAMDTASRDARARGMGFLSHPGTDDFVTVYHGTNKEISPGFLLNPPTRATNAASAEAGIWTSESPSVAQGYAEHAARAGEGEANVLPLRVRAHNIGTLHPTPELTELQVLGALRDAWDAAYDAVRVPFPSTLEGLPATTNWVVKEPSQLRSPSAVFDPTKRDSSDLMAGIAAPGPVLSPPGASSTEAAPATSTPSPFVTTDLSKLNSADVTAGVAPGLIVVPPFLPSPAAATPSLIYQPPSTPALHVDQPFTPDWAKRPEDRVY
jgi:hypothetical protein